MLLGNRRRKFIAALLLTILLTELVTPTVTYALTSGPTTPETTSFEPVDTTDMVSLQTGDMTYNIPLMEVPGPEGGYPLALSYHAGVQPNEEASWVGLGWSLNPGAVTRSVNNLPDDWKGIGANSHQYWSGGSTTKYNVGINVGITNSAFVNAGLSFSQDTYKGFGMGIEAGATIKTLFGNFSGGIGLSTSEGFTKNLSYELEFGHSFKPTSNENGQDFISLTGSFKYSTNFESSSTGFDIGVTNRSKTQTGSSTSSMGVSIQSGKISGFSFSGNQGSFGSTSTTAAKIQTESSSASFGFMITPKVSIGIGISFLRYFIDSYTTMSANGSMYGSGGTLGDDILYDTYSLLEDPAYKSIVYNPDPTLLQGGSYMDFDNYSVTGQGIGGQMRPYQFKGEIIGQNRKNANSNALVTYYSPGADDPKPQFRFINDFSNTYRQSYNEYSSPSVNLKTTLPPFDGAPVYGNGDGNDGFSDNKLAGSKHIDIGVKIKPSNIYGYNRTERLGANMIEGFSITNESGVTYHYSLPAYSFNEEIYQEKIDRSGGLAFNRTRRYNPYAYTWHLTSITGPDFVDRNGDQMAGAGDWGYWVNFEYGKWSNNYVWRNPSQGYNRDADNNFRNVSLGTKEVYYLNAIRTRTHVAFFEKDTRPDGKSEEPSIYEMNNWTDYKSEGEFQINSRSSLRLKTIYLMNAEDVDPVDVNAGDPKAFESYFDRNVACLTNTCSMAKNILDITDIDDAGRNKIEEKSIRIIDFKQDFSLGTNTPNSFDIQVFPFVFQGKMALKSIGFRGKTGGIPAMSFEYDLPDEDVVTGTGTLSSTTFSSNQAEFQVGDLLVTNDANRSFCGVIWKKTENPGLGSFLYELKNSAYTGGAISSVRTTKNPPYNKDAYDVWGMYKSDINMSVVNDNENLGRRTSPVSAKAVDVWSLRKIKTSMGNEIKIKYESDQIRKAVIQNTYPLKVIPLNNTYYFSKFKLETGGNDINEFVKPGDLASVLFGAVFQLTDGSGGIAGGVTLDFADFKVSTVDPDGTITGTYMGGIPPALPGTVPRIGAGNFTVKNSTGIYGGGLRVAEISVSTPGGTKLSTQYNYNSPGAQESSGITTYMPGVFDSFSSSAGNTYKEKLYSKASSLIAVAREIPSPGVFYEYVTVTGKVKNPEETEDRNSEGKTVYQFEVPRENMILREDVSARTNTNTGAGRMLIHNLALKKFTSNIGSVKRVVRLDKYNRKISETINHYLHDNLAELPPKLFFDGYKNLLQQYRYQGFIQERFSEVKELTNQSNSSENGVRGTMSGKEDYPSVLTGTTQINYLANTTSTTNNLEYDFYSGALTKSETRDPYGNLFITEVIPAYKRYGALGLKTKSADNKNMLTQEAGKYIYRYENGVKTDLVSATANVWSNTVPVFDNDGGVFTQNGGANGNVWRMHSSYNWVVSKTAADGLTPYNDFVDFNWLNPGANTSWKKILEFTKYDPWSKVLEEKNMLGLLNSQRLEHGSKRVILKGSLAGFYEIAYGSAEDDGILQVSEQYMKKADGVLVESIGAHTGKRGLQLGANGKKCFVYDISTSKLVAGRNYIAHVWVKPVTGTDSDAKLYYSVNGVQKAVSISSGSATKKAGDWTLLDLVINGADIISGATLSVGCRNDHASAEVYADDMRFRPLDGNSTAYVYNQLSGSLTHVLDNNNLFVKYDYDGMGRLTATYNEKLGVGVFKTDEYHINYGATKVGNAAVNTVVTKNNCGSLLVPQRIPVTIPANTYFDYTQQAADKLAMDAAQAQANTTGTCNAQTPFYARFETFNASTHQEDSWSIMEADVYIKFYADAACTIPLTLTNQLDFKWVYTFSPNNFFGRYKITNSVNTQSVFVGRRSIEATESGWDEYGQWSYTIYHYHTLESNGPYYTVKPIVNH